ncbi:GlsB/YeaQ/YmgE family stress response membrane protein [Anaerosinus massiliensis]|uniref:GlsB/YeaQ/YmgE family stress response membrane protein n=1 Tax=Massilibacillus massiliensis TaxID=1806837 RepID=UPI0018FE5EA7|nr:GlsB/YeaQ/YmgE family stress response membrane protein [Massilibacillus massiliensis]
MGSLIWSIIIGAIAGWLAGQMMKGHGFGIWANIIVGIIGAFIGNFTLSLVGIAAYGLLGQLIASLLGSMILVWLISLFSGRESSAH